MSELISQELQGRSHSEPRRRSRRVSTQLWVGLEGSGREPLPCRGDICATGVYLATSLPMGSPGDVVMLELGCSDRSKPLNTLARITRVLRQDDRARNALVVGTALEFLPLDTLSQGVSQLLTEITQSELMHMGVVRLEEPIALMLRTPRLQLSGELRSLGASHLMVGSEEAIEPGSSVELLVRHEHGNTELEMQVGSCLHSQNRNYPHSLLLTLPREPGTRSLLGLASALVLPAELQQRAAPGKDFSGRLGAVTMRQLLDFLEREKQSGVLSVGTETDFYSIEVGDGEIQSCECATGLAPALALEEVEAMTDGDFKFTYHRSIQASSVATAGSLLSDLMQTAS